MIDDESDRQMETQGKSRMMTVTESIKVHCRGVSVHTQEFCEGG